MNREGGAWKVTLPASTRRSTSSSSPSYHTLRLLLLSYSRWLSKSTLTCRRRPTTPDVRILYWGFGVIVGNPGLHPEIACCRSIALHCRLRNRSAFSSNRTASCICRSAYGPNTPLRAAPWKDGGPLGWDRAPGDTTVAARPPTSKPRGRRSRSSRSHVAATSAAGRNGPSRPPGASAGLRGARSGSTRNAGSSGGGATRPESAAAPCARAWCMSSVPAIRPRRVSRRIPCRVVGRRI